MNEITYTAEETGTCEVEVAITNADGETITTETLSFVAEEGDAVTVSTDTTNLEHAPLASVGGHTFDVSIPDHTNSISLNENE